MKPLARIAIIAIIASLCSYVLRGEELIDVTASVDKQSAYIGDLIEYSIAITYDSTIQLTPPAAGANLGGFEVKDYNFGEEERLKEGKRRQLISFKLRTFTTGDYVIPPLPIEYKTADSTVKYISADPIKIFIKSMLAEGENVDSLQPRPLKAQASLTGKSRTLWLIIGGAVIIMAAGVGYYMWRRRRGLEPAPYVDPRPSWEIAYTDLAMLKNKNMPEQGEVKKYYFELSEIMKRYLGRKFEFGAVDMTTTEIGEYLTQRSLDESLHEEIIGFSEHADLVKFAKYVPPADRPGIDWDAAYELVTKTKDLMITPPVVTESEPVLVASGDDKEAYEGDPDLRFAPPELRQYFSSDKKEDIS